MLQPAAPGGRRQKSPARKTTAASEQLGFHHGRPSYLTQAPSRITERNPGNLCSSPMLTGGRGTHHFPRWKPEIGVKWRREDRRSQEESSGTDRSSPVIESQRSVFLSEALGQPLTQHHQGITDVSHVLNSPKFPFPRRNQSQNPQITAGLKHFLLLAAL